MALLDITSERLAQDIEAIHKDGEDTAEIEALQDDHADVVGALVSSKAYVWCSASGSITLTLPKGAIEGISDGTLTNIQELTTKYPESYTGLEEAMMDQEGLIELITDSHLDIIQPARLYPHELLWALLTLAHQEITAKGNPQPEAA